MGELGIKRYIKLVKEMAMPGSVAPTDKAASVDTRMIT